MPSQKQYRKPKCVCGARKNAEGRCSATPSCDDFRKPAERVRSFELGRKPAPEQGSMLTALEARAAFHRLGFPALDTNPNAGVRKRAL